MDPPMSRRAVIIACLLTVVLGGAILALRLGPSWDSVFSASGRRAGGSGGEGAPEAGSDFDPDLRSSAGEGVGSGRGDAGAAGGRSVSDGVPGEGGSAGGAPGAGGAESSGASAAG